MHILNEELITILFGITEKIGNYDNLLNVVHDRVNQHSSEILSDPEYLMRVDIVINCRYTRKLLKTYKTLKGLSHEP